MEMAEPRPNARQRGVRQRFGDGHARLAEPLLGCGERGLKRLLDFVEAFPGGRFVGRWNTAQTLLCRLQPAALGAKKLNSCGFERLSVARALERRLTGRRELIELGQKIP